MVGRARAAVLHRETKQALFSNIKSNAPKKMDAAICNSDEAVTVHGERPALNLDQPHPLPRLKLLLCARTGILLRARTELYFTFYVRPNTNLQIMERFSVR